MNTTGVVEAPVGVNRFYETTPVYEVETTLADEGSSVMDGFRRAGLDFRVEKRPLFRNVNGFYSKHDGVMETYNADTNQGLGVVGSKYGVMQNETLAAMLQNLQDKGLITPVAFKSLKGGEGLMGFFDLHKEIEVIPGDTLSSRMVVRNSHNGGTSVDLGVITDRNICTNVTPVLTRTAGRSGMSVKHTGTVRSRTEQMVHIIERMLTDIDGTLLDARRMASTPLSDEGYTIFLDRVFPKPAEETDSGRMSPKYSRWLDTVGNVNRLYKHDELCNLDGMRGTGWAAFNAVTAYYDHMKKDRGGNVESMLVSRVSGPISKIKEKAYRAAMASLN